MFTINSHQELHYAVLEPVIIPSENFRVIRTFSEDPFWIEQNKQSGDDRIMLYKQNLKAFRKDYPSATEDEFLKEQIEECKATLERVNTSIPIQKSVMFHVKRYMEFLEAALKANQESADASSAVYKKIPFNLPRQDLGVLFLLLVKANILPPLGNNQLARLIEQFCYANLNDQVTSMKQLLSNLRNNLNPAHSVDRIVQKICNAKIEDDDDDKHTPVNDK